ncbi:putative membrane protein [Pedobacter sp. CAN_A7]
MKILMAILFLFIGIIVLALVAALFINKEYVVEREVVINKPRQEVYNYIKYLKNQDNFSKWANLDPAMEKVYRGNDGTVGAVSAWNSKQDNVGQGEQEITKIVEGKSIETELRFIRPFKITCAGLMTTDDYQGIATKVKWSFFGKMPYPMNLMIPLMNVKTSIANDLDVGLGNLKVIMEGK